MVDLRDADIDDKQLRDDLMTMLIAGHETTAAVLTWTLFQLMQAPEAMQKAVQEAQQVLSDQAPGQQSYSCFTVRVWAPHRQLCIDVVQGSAAVQVPEQ